MKESKYIRYITFLAAFSALAYISVVFLKFPLIGFLKYEPKDVFVVLGGILFGPLFTILLSMIVPFFEMITVSSTGVIGFIMNVVATIFFVLPPVLFYSRKINTKSLLIGSILGTLSLLIIMLLWNYFLTPFFFGYSREAVVKMLIPVIVPFNLIKGGINTVAIVLLYKPITDLLIKTNLIKKEDLEGITGERKIVSIIVSVILLVTILFVALSYLKVI